MTGSPGSAFNIQSSKFSVQSSRFHSEHRHPQQALIRVIRAIRGQIPFAPPAVVDRRIRVVTTDFTDNTDKEGTRVTETSE